MADNTTQSNGSCFGTSLLVVLGTVAVFAVLVFLAYGLRGRDAPVTPVAGGVVPPSAATLRAKEAEILSSYGWVNKDSGVVHIPVDRAKDLVIQELNK